MRFCSGVAYCDVGCEGQTFFLRGGSERAEQDRLGIPAFLQHFFQIDLHLKDRKSIVLQ